MEEKQNKIKSIAVFSLLQYVILGVMSLVLLHLYGAQAIQESMMPLDCLLCNLFSRLTHLKLDFCTNPVFVFLLWNGIILRLLVTSGLLSSSSEAPDLSKAYGIEGVGQRVQIAAEPCWIQKKSSLHQHERQDEADFTCNESIRKGEKTSIFAENERASEIYLTENFEEESKWNENYEMVAIVPYQSALADNNEELKRRCDEFIATVRRQMSLQNGYS